jgi:hypothetical protein
MAFSTRPLGVVCATRWGAGVIDEGQRGIDSAFERLLPDQTDVSSERSGRSAEQQTQNQGSSHLRNGHRSASDPVSRETVPVRAGSCDSASIGADQIPHLDIIDRLAAENGKESISLPFALRVLVAAAVNPIVGARACIILPDVERIAELVAAIAALVALREDWPRLKDAFIKEVLQPGLRVRSLREGKVITFCGMIHDLAHLQYVDAKGSKSNASLFVKKDMVFGLEPSQRKRPIFHSGEKPERPFRTPFDVVAGTRTFGNTGMIRNRVVLLGQQQRFEDALTEAAIILARDPKGRKIRAFRQFVWGHIDDKRKSVVTHPRDATGEPLIAVTQDVLLLNGPEMREGRTKRILISGRFELVRRNLEIIQRFAEHNRVLVLAPADRRDEARKLRESGWSVWEPRGWELHAAAGQRALRGLPGLSRSLRSLSVDGQQSTFSTVRVRSPELQRAHDHASAIGAALPPDESEMDARLDEVRQASSDLFFLIASLLEAPDRGDLARFNEAIAMLNKHRRHVERCLGAAVAEHISKLSDCANTFLASHNGQKTPKGEALLNFARSVSLRTHAFVAGFGRDRGRLADLLEANGEQGFLSLTVQGLRDVRKPSRLVAFGLMRRDGFAQLVDPWPANEITFIGYDFEIERYETRLRQRDRLRDRLGLDDGPRSRVTGLPPSEFGHCSLVVGRLPAEPTRGTAEADDSATSGFDRLVGTRRTRVHRPVISRKAGETIVQARYMTFCGTSWAAFTEEHEVLAVRGGSGSKSSVVEMEVPDLVAATQLIIRESGDKDVIREMAEGDVGEQEYIALRERAALWKRAIRRCDLSPMEIARKLSEVGVNRSLATIRGWLKSESRIGPRSKADVLGIAEAFPIDGAGERRWEDCAEAIAEIRGLHLSAGAKLTHILATQCENVLVDAAEHEQRVELDFGTVWIVEIAEIDENLSEWPISSANRLNWSERSTSPNITLEDL